MIDKEKVRKGLYEAIDVIESYVPVRHIGYAEQACWEAIALLKDQEEKTPNLMQDAKGIWSVCPNCGYVLKTAIYNLMETETEKSFFHFPNFCAKCGQKVKW